MEGTLINHTHDDGRACVVSKDGVTWRYWEAPFNQVGGLICYRAHPAKEKRIEVDVTKQVQEAADRGAFGMPGVGSVARAVLSWSPPPGLLDSDLVTHPPDHIPSRGTHDWPATFDVGKWARDRGINWPTHTHVGNVKQFMLALFHEPETDLARAVMERHLPEAIDHFLMRNAEYGDDDDFDLGVSGQYVDISRKVQKLKRRWWDGEDVPDGAESDKVIIQELIGHLLMSLHYLEQEEADGEAG